MDWILLEWWFARFSLSSICWSGIKLHLSYDIHVSCISIFNFQTYWRPKYQVCNVLFSRIYFLIHITILISRIFSVVKHQRMIVFIIINQSKGSLLPAGLVETNPNAMQILLAVTVWNQLFGSQQLLVLVSFR